MTVHFRYFVGSSSTELNFCCRGLNGDLNLSFHCYSWCLMPAVSNWVLSLFSFSPSAAICFSVPSQCPCADDDSRCDGTIWNRVCSYLLTLFLLCLELQIHQCLWTQICRKKNKKQKTTSANQRSCAFNSVSGVQCLVFCICTSFFLSFPRDVPEICVRVWVRLLLWFDSDGLFRTMIDDVKADQSSNRKNRK